jgi:predicted GH43/DUF377 family glycosyl hydrolase
MAAPSASPERPSTPWVRHPANPVLGGTLGTCFDAALLREGSTFRMWFSWRPKRSVALVESGDGVHWDEPRVVLPPAESDWEGDINRPVVVKRGGNDYHMWYTGQSREQSWIGYATSPNGVEWKRMTASPVLSPDLAWEKAAVMCPHVIWDENRRVFRMWYSGGEQYEPDAIGYAESGDGLAWTKRKSPVFSADPSSRWEQHKVTACQVLVHDGWFYMFYIGFRDIDHAAIGIARSKNGVSGWERFAGNPIVSPDPEAWDADACYKPFVLPDGNRWMLWYNGRRGEVEQIGLAIHGGPEFWDT